jgi:NAD(P)-dependent dehydrogenase (short-subunit alcohol dehydrogenase family)
MTCVLVTGAGSVLGPDTAITLARAGYPVLAAVPSAADAHRLRAAADAAQASVGVAVLDPAEEGPVRDRVRALAAAHGGVHAVVHLVGGTGPGELTEVSAADCRLAWERDVLGLLRVTRAALPWLARARGRLIAVTGIGGAVGLPGWAADCAVRFAVEGLLEAFTPAAAARGVRVTVLEHGPLAGPPPPGWTTEPETPAAVADAVLDVLCAPDPAPRGQTSAAATRFVATKLADIHGTAARTGW